MEKKTKNKNKKIKNKNRFIQSMAIFERPMVGGMQNYEEKY